MKNLILSLFLILGVIHFSNAQADYGVKAGINYNSDSFRDVKGDVLDSNAESKTGFHAGLWARFKLPIVGFYIRPELVYTSLKSEVTSGDEKADYDFQKIDLPVLFGKKILKIAHIYAGPSFQYIIDGDLDINNFKTEVDGFTVGIQLGAGIELGKIGLDVRWERAFSDVESELITNGITATEFDTRVNQIIIGLSYKF